MAQTHLDFDFATSRLCLALIHSMFCLAKFMSRLKGCKKGEARVLKAPPAVVAGSTGCSPRRLKFVASIRSACEEKSMLFDGCCPTVRCQQKQRHLLTPLRPESCMACSLKLSWATDMVEITAGTWNECWTGGTVSRTWSSMWPLDWWMRCQVRGIETAHYACRSPAASS